MRPIIRLLPVCALLWQAPAIAADAPVVASVAPGADGRWIAELLFTNADSATALAPPARLSARLRTGKGPGTTVTLDAGNMHPEFGAPVREFREGSGKERLWIRYYDGTQTAAGVDLIAAYGGDEARPWLSDMIGRGLCMAKVTARGQKPALSLGSPISWEE